MKVYMTINTLLYGGFFLIISGVILFIVSIIKLREIETQAPIIISALNTINKNIYDN